MQLSVCCLTGHPGPQVAALLNDLRDVADEIVVAADSRADEERLAFYGSVADRLLRVEVAGPGRTLGWLFAQCAGDWILHIDGDEVVSAALATRLPELVRERRVHQYLLPRRWLFPGADQWLDELPWWPDYQVRLVRNDGLLRTPGLRHTHALPVRPARYLETPIYHLDLLLSTRSEREAKSSRYERSRPGLTAPGGGSINERFYLPERDASRLAPVPAADRPAIDRVLRAAGPPPARTALPAVVPLAETDRYFSGRELDPDAYAAEVTPLERLQRMRPGERRPVHFRFVNRGTERWPWDPELGPPIRVSNRWRTADGALVVADGPRTMFPCELGPGEATVVPVDAIAPPVPGDYVLEADIVHEGVRWFDCAAGVEVHVTGNRVSPPPRGSPPPGRPGLIRRIARLGRTRLGSHRPPRASHDG